MVQAHAPIGIAFGWEIGRFPQCGDRVFKITGHPSKASAGSSETAEPCVSVWLRSESTRAGRSQYAKPSQRDRGKSANLAKGIGFRGRIKTPDRAAAGPAALLHNEEHGTAPGAVQRAASLEVPRQFITRVCLVGGPALRTGTSGPRGRASWSLAASIRRANIDHSKWSSRRGDPHAYPPYPERIVGESRASAQMWLLLVVARLTGSAT